MWRYSWLQLSFSMRLVPPYRQQLSFPTDSALSCRTNWPPQWQQIVVKDGPITRFDSLADRPYLNRFFASALSRSEEHTSELQSQSNLVCRLLLEKKKNKQYKYIDHNYNIR